MKAVLIVITALVSFTLQAQHKNSKHKILIGFNFSPDYSFRTLKGDNSAAANTVIDNRKNTELAKLGCTTGFNLLFNSNKNIAFETGIQYSNKGFKTKSINLFYSDPSPSSPLTFRTNYAYQYIGIPLKARVEFGKTRLHAIASAGVMANFLLNVKKTFTYTYYDDHTETKKQSTTSNFNTIDIAPMVSIGVDYKLNGKIHLMAEPTFRYGLIKTVDATVTERLWSAGVNVGFYYGIK